MLFLVETWSLLHGHRVLRIMLSFTLLCHLTLLRSLYIASIIMTEKPLGINLSSCGLKLTGVKIMLLCLFNLHYSLFTILEEQGRSTDVNYISV